MFRDHPEFGQNPRLGVEGQPFQLAICLYYDGVETANCLGFARGKHSIGCIYICLVNLDKSIRMSRPYIMPVTIVLEQDMKRYGAALVVSGADSTSGEIVPSHWSSFGAQMRLLHQHDGVEWAVPAVQGGICQQAFRAHLILVCADFPAKGKLTPFAESTSTACPSGGSNWDKNDGQAFKPFSFLQAKINGNKVSNKWKLRELRPLEAIIRGGSASDLKRLGVMKRVYALQSSLVPLADCITMCPEDPMHGEPDGNLRRSGYRTLYMMCKQWGVSTDELNQAIGKYNWPPGQRPPELHVSIEKGAAGGRPSSDGKWRYSASQGLYFAKHSITFLNHLVKDPAARFWVCWVKHVEYVNILMQDEFSRDDVFMLDRKIYEYQSAVDLVPEYQGCKKPKDAFSFLYAVNILRNGPPRTYWCMTFESFNQVCKRIVEASNYKTVCKRVLEVWSLRSARALVLGRVAGWGATKPVYLHSEPVVITESTDDDVAARLFGAVFDSRITLELMEVSAVHHLGGDFDAGSTWVIHESKATGDVYAALARVDRLFEVSTDGQSFLFIFLQRYAHVSLVTHGGEAKGIEVRDTELAEPSGDILCHLPDQLLTVLHHTITSATNHHFLFL